MRTFLLEQNVKRVKIYCNYFHYGTAVYVCISSGCILYHTTKCKDVEVELVGLMCVVGCRLVVNVVGLGLVSVWCCVVVWWGMYVVNN